jgi:hypothetical protein
LQVANSSSQWSQFMRCSTQRCRHIGYQPLQEVCAAAPMASVPSSARAKLQETTIFSIPFSSA